MCQCFTFSALPEEDEQTIIALICHINFNELEPFLNTIIMITMIYNIIAFSNKLHHGLEVY